MTVKTRIRHIAKTGALVCMGLALAGCEEGLELPFGTMSTTEPAAEIAPSGAAELAGLDVEAPEVFETAEQGLWDGRPSLGGVWVAHPDATDPERVLITNTLNGQTVVGALFRRERDNPGPALQVSSDAAAALNVIAGSPTELTVVALRRAPEPEPLDIPVAPPEPQTADTSETEAPAPQLAAAVLDPLPEVAATPAVMTAEIIDPIEIAATAAIAEADILADLAAEQTPSDTIESLAAAPAPAAAPIATSALPAAAPASASLNRPFVQIGIFADDANAESAADDLRRSGVIPTILSQENDSGEFWRVIVGPAQSVDERSALLATVQGLGFSDAYFVTN